MATPPGEYEHLNAAMVTGRWPEPEPVFAVAVALRKWKP